MESAKKKTVGAKIEEKKKVQETPNKGVPVKAKSVDKKSNEEKKGAAAKRFARGGIGRATVRRHESIIGPRSVMALRLCFAR